MNPFDHARNYQKKVELTPLSLFHLPLFTSHRIHGVMANIIMDFQERREMEMGYVEFHVHFKQRNCILPSGAVSGSN